jgi:hypothetical protein
LYGNGVLSGAGRTRLGLKIFLESQHSPKGVVGPRPVDRSWFDPLRRDSSVHNCQRGELSVRGLARTRLKCVAVGANVNDGFNELDRPVTQNRLES